MGAFFQTDRRPFLEWEFNILSIKFWINIWHECALKNLGPQSAKHFTEEADGTVLFKNGTSILDYVPWDAPNARPELVFDARKDRSQPDR